MKTGRFVGVEVRISRTGKHVVLGCGVGTLRKWAWEQQRWAVCLAERAGSKIQCFVLCYKRRVRLRSAARFELVVS